MPDSNMTLSRNDFQWYDPEAGSTSSTDMGDYSGTNVTQGRTGGWGMTPEARARLGQWGTTNQANVGWGNNIDRDGDSGMGGDSMGQDFDSFFGGGGKYYDPYNGPGFNQEGLGSRDWLDNFFNQKSFGGQMKTGDKEATRYAWTRQPDGTFTQSAAGPKFNINTNNDHTKAAATLAAVGGMALAGPALTGLSNSLSAGALPSLSQAGAGFNFANTVTGGQIPGLREASMVTSLGSNVGNLANLATNGVNTLEDIAKLGQTGYNVYSKGSNLMDAFNPQQPPPRPQGTTDAGYGYANGPGVARQGPGTGVYANGMPGESNFDLGSIIQGITGRAGGGGTGLLDIYGAYRGTQEARDEAERLKKMYEEAQGRRQPVLDRLNESYINPDSFYDSNQWKGLSSVYQNSIDRKAAQGGRMENPTDREVLMQQHAMKGMQDYRGGLQQQLTALNPDQYINPYMRGSTREAGSFNPISALGGRGSVGGPGQQGGASGLEQIIKMIQQGGGAAAGGIQNLIRQLTGGGGGYNPGAQAPGTEYVGSDEIPVGGLEPQYGEPQISYGNDLPGMDYGNVMSGGGFNPGGFNGDLGGANNFGYDFGDSGFDINDMSWINGFDFNLP